MAEITFDKATVRYFIMKTDEGAPMRLAFGNVIKETEKHIEIQGMWMVIGVRAIEPTDDTFVPAEGKAYVEPFAPIGPKISQITIPLTRIEGELHDVPRQYAEAMANIYVAETANKIRREKLLSMPVPTRIADSPEEALARMAQYINEYGKLPDTIGTGYPMDLPDGTVSANFRVIPISPYREEMSNGD